MFTPRESAQLFDINRRLRELHVQRAAAQSTGDHDRADELQAEIDALTQDCNSVLDADEAI